jgi:hypothetical protein
MASSKQYNADIHDKMYAIYKCLEKCGYTFCSRQDNFSFETASVPAGIQAVDLERKYLLKQSTEGEALSLDEDLWIHFNVKPRDTTTFSFILLILHPFCSFKWTLKVSVIPSIIFNSHSQANEAHIPPLGDLNDLTKLLYTHLNHLSVKAKAKTIATYKIYMSRSSSSRLHHWSV